MKMLYTVWSIAFGICRLRLGPQDLPASPLFMVFMLLIYSIINGFISVVQDMPLETAMLSGIVETMLLILFTGSLLYITRYSSRIVQTIIAITMSESILGLAVIPLIIWYRLQIKEHIIGVSFILLLTLIIWSIVVHAHILRHALTIPFFTGLTIAITTLFLTVNILSTLFPFPE